MIRYDKDTMNTMIHCLIFLHVSIINNDYDDDVSYDDGICSDFDDGGNVGACLLSCMVGYTHTLSQHCCRFFVLIKSSSFIGNKFH